MPGARSTPTRRRCRASRAALLGTLLALVSALGCGEDGAGRAGGGKDGGGEAGEDRRTFDLEAGEFLHLAVDQQGVDLVLRWSGPGVELEIDTPNGSHGLEELITVIERAGRYHLEIAPLDTADGRTSRRFHLTQVARRPASDRDRRHAAADRQFRRFVELYWAPEEASTVGETARAAWLELGAERRAAETARLLLTTYRRSERHRDSALAGERALPWFRAAGDRQRLGRLLLELGKAHLRLGANLQAEERLREAVEVAQDVDRCLFAEAATAQAQAFKRLGRPHLALERLDQARVEAGVCPSHVHANRALELANTLLSLDRAAEATVYFSRARQLYQAAGSRGAEILALGGLIDSAVQAGRLDEATRLAGEVEVLYGDRPVAAALLYKIGRVHQFKDEAGPARRHFELALEGARAAHDREFEVAALLSLGRLAAETGDPEASLSYFETAREVLERGGDSPRKMDSHGWIARALRELGRLEEAWVELERALDQLDALRRKVPQADLRLSYFANQQDYYAQALDLLADLDQRSPAAGWSRRALRVHDRRLARELVESRTTPRPGAASAVEEAVQSELEQLSTQLAAWAQKPPSEEREHHISTLLRRLYQLRERLRPDPEKEPGAPALDLDSLQQTLPDGALVLVFAFGEERLYAWEIGRHELRFHRLGARRETETRTRQFSTAFGDDLTLVPRLGAMLGKLLLEPVRERLQRARDLVIVPDGALHQIPWTALVPPGGPEPAFLVETHTVRLLPSLAYAALSERERRPAGSAAKAERGIAVLADPVFSARDPRLAGGAAPLASKTAEDESLSRAAHDLGIDLSRRLPGTRREADAIAELLPAGRRLLLLQGFDATRERFFALPFSELGILHLATHALPHPRPELAGLVLSGRDAEGRAIPGFVHFFAIADLELDLDLVVLSACDTGAGQTLAGEGMLGLSRSFLSAGAAQVLASLWRVDDRWTAALMRHFYAAHWQQGRPPAAALALAQRRLIDEPRATVRDWAPFVLQGAWHD